MKMENVMTLRLPKEDVQFVEEFAKEEKVDKSTAMRGLVELGKVYFAIRKYAEGKISIGRAAEIAGISISEMMDLLSELRIPSRLDVEDYLEGMKVAEKMIR